MKQKDIQQNMNSLQLEIFELEHDTEIEEKERLYKEMVARGDHKARKKRRVKK